MKILGKVVMVTVLGVVSGTAWSQDAAMSGIILVSSPQAPEAAGPTTVRKMLNVPRFASTEVLDVDFNVIFPRTFVGKHTLYVEVRTPRGHLFERRTVPVAEADAPTFTKVVDYPRPVAVERLQPFALDGQDFRVVKVRFPVAGTAIVKSGLYGTWQVTVFVDDQTEPYSQTQFVLVDRTPPVP